MPTLPGGEPYPKATLRRALIVGALFAAGAAAFLYYVVPQLAGLDETWRRLGDGEPAWLVAALFFELLSFGGYVVLFRAAVSDGVRLDWSQSYRITMAGLAATRLFATAGAGGIALTVWALRRLRMPRREVATRVTTFLVAMYSVFMAALLLVGVGLYTGVFPGSAPVGLTVVPAVFGAAVIGAALGSAAFIPRRQRAPEDPGARSTRTSTWRRRLSGVPAAFSGGTRGALMLARRGDPRLLGAVAWWGFDAAVLWASFEAFGHAPEAAVIVMGYFTGMLANTLPLPGGLGAVEGGMIGAYIGFGVPGGLAIVAVLTYRVYAYWLPTVPGAIAFAQLVRAPRE